MNSIIQDLRYAVRAMLASPSFSAIAVLTLALGIGANSAIFSYVDATWLRPLPVPDSARLVRAYSEERDSPGTRARGDSSYVDYLDIRSQSKLLQDVVAYEHRGALLHRPGEVIQLPADTVSPNYFSALGVAAALGRTFTENDLSEGRFPVVISYSVWQQKFGGDRNIVGHDVRLTNGMVTILGVMSSEFRGLEVGTQAAVWVPAPTWTHITGDTATFTRRGSRRQAIVARMRKGTSIAAVRSELATIGSRLAQSYPDADKDLKLTAEPEAETRSAGTERQGWLLLAISGMVLLIACANVINLQLARTETRRKEFAIRLALGGSVWRLLQQLLTESVVLATAALALGLLLANWIILALPQLTKSSEDVGYDFRLDSRILLVSCAVAFLVAVLFGVAAGWHASHIELIGGLKRSDISVGREHGVLLRDVLVAAQVALSLVLLVGAGLLIRTLIKVEAVDPGFDSRQPMLLVDVVPGLAQYEGSKLENYNHKLLENMNALPGVEKSALAVRVPFGTSGGGAQQEVLRPGTVPPVGQLGYSVNFTWVSPEYFSVIGTRVLAGRTFTDQDGANSQVVAIVNQTLAKQLWPDGNVVGQPMTALSIFGQALQQPRQYQVVGVVEDSKWNFVTERSRPILYLCMWQGADSEATLLLRTHGNPAAMVTTVREELLSIDKNVPMLLARTLRQHVELTTRNERNRVLLSSTFGTLGLLLSAAGIYSVLSYFVTRRTREIGLRMALGAAAPTILEWVLRRGLRLVIIGIAVGLASAMALGRLMVGFLYGVQPFDPVTLGGVAALLAAIGVVAIYLPARRASKVDPMEALRTL